MALQVIPISLRFPQSHNTVMVIFFVFHTETKANGKNTRILGHNMKIITNVRFTALSEGIKRDGNH